MVDERVQGGGPAVLPAAVVVVRAHVPRHLQGDESGVRLFTTDEAVIVGFKVADVDCNPGTVTAPASLSRAISAVNLASSYRFTRRLRGPTGDSLRRAALAPPTRSYMHNFFKPVATSTGGEPAPKRSRPSVPTWKAVHESMLVRDDPGCRPNHRIAAFDLDDTLQKTRSGKPGYMVTDLGDFVPWNARVPSKLRALHDAGYKVVIFSNQGGVKGAMEGKRADVVRARLDAFAKEVGIPVQALCATQKGEKDPKNYRKPKSSHCCKRHCLLDGQRRILQLCGCGPENTMHRS